VKRGYLGIEMAQDVSAEVAGRLGMKPGQGVIVARVVENSPAAKAGLKPDDVITALNGEALHDNRSLVRTVGNLPIGQAVSVEVLRDGKPQKLSLTLEPTPEGYGVRKLPQRGARVEGDPVTVEKFGLTLVDLSADRADAYGVKGGALVTRVDPDGPAAEAGVARGLVIAKVDKKDVSSAEAAKAALEKADANKGALVHLRSLDGAAAIVVIKPSK
jgi:serine protease Do